MNRPLRNLGFGCVGLVVLAFSTVRAEPGAPPPRFDYTVEAGATGSTRLHGSSDRTGGSSSSLSASAAVRHGVVGDWFATAGIQVDDFQFTSGPVSHLQDVAASCGIEYYRDGEKVASIVAHPGIYFGGNASAAAFDIPVDAVTGVPLFPRCNGAIGFSNARFYHHPLPIFGIVWTPQPALRVQLVYPETSIEYRLNEKTRVHLGGELVGGGFRADLAGHPRTPIEYSSYRVSVGVSRTVAPNVTVSAMVGVEAIREFDAFRAGVRYRASGAPFIGFQLGSGD